MWVWVREFGLNVLANIAASAASPTDMIGYVVALGFGLAWLIKWHRSRIAKAERGMDSWYFIGLSLVVAAVAIGAAAYGIGLRSAHVTSEGPPNKASPTSTATAAPLSDFEWGFERHPGYYFIGVSADADQKLLVHFFQAQGFNRTSDPLTKVDGYVRSDRTGQKYPIYFNVPPSASRALPSEINPIPVDAIIDVRAPFLAGDALMPMKQFLAEVVPFTFFFEYDGKTYRHSFPLEDIEPLIRQYEQEIRKTAVKPPQMSAKTTKFYSERNKSDLADALTDLTKLLNGAADNIVSKTDTIMKMWDQRRHPVTAAAMTELTGKLNELSDETIILNRTLYDDDGFIKKNAAYADEINSILRLPGNSQPSHPLTILQVSLNGFRDGISTIERAAKYDDNRLVDDMTRSMTPALFAFQKGDEQFRQWLGETRERVQAFRKTLG